MNPYETDKLLNEYLLFHYGKAEEILPWPDGPKSALDYAVRCVTECVDQSALTPQSRALDLGCAVGRSTFELARSCGEVIGIDYSNRFVETAQILAANGSLAYLRIDEGELTTPLLARIAPEIDRSRVKFEHGDAQKLRADLGTFDVVLGANLVDRLSAPDLLLERLPKLVKPGGQLVLTTPCTWMEDFTPHKNWLGGFMMHDAPRTTLQGLKSMLGRNFSLTTTLDMPFLIREHARKFQWSVAMATIWKRN